MMEYKASKMNVIKKGDKIKFEKVKEKEMIKVGDKFIVEISGVMKNEDTRFQKPIYLIKNMDIAVTEETIESLERCEEKQKDDEEIKVGDEIENGLGTRAVVTRVEKNLHECLGANGFFYLSESINLWKKTEKHYDEVEKIFQKLKESEGEIPFL